MNEIASSTGPSAITFEDVVEALGDTDISTTNASKLRSILGGRGSFSTIQKHLDTIRAQRIHAQQPEAVPVPAAPPELLQMWGAAVQIATAQVRTRLDGVVQERDTLTAELQSSRNDVLALADELESTSAQLEAATATAARVAAEQMASEQSAAQALQAAGQTHNAALQSAVQVLQAADQAHAAEVGGMRLELEAAQHLVKTTRLEAQLGASALQSTLDRLTGQIGELKGLLHSQKDSK